MRFEEEIKSKIRSGISETLNCIEEVYETEMDCLDTDEEREGTFLFVKEEIINEISKIKLGIDFII